MSAMLKVNNEKTSKKTMNTFDAIKERRSVKHYDPNHNLSDDEINELMSYGGFISNII